MEASIVKIAVVLGTRPEAIKLAPVVRAARARRGAEVRVIFTGQHRTMVDQLAEFLELSADVDLDIMRPGQSLADVAARTLTGLAPVLASEKPDWVVVQGDTTTAFAAALGAFYGGVKVAHVEAGLRSGNLRSPWPEEANRVLVGRITDLHLAPTRRAAKHLLDEGIAEAHVHVVGNTVVDALRHGLGRIEGEGLADRLAEGLPRLDPARKLVLVTGHRRESFGQPFREICAALRELAETEPVEIVYPVHLNPKVREPVEAILAGARNVHLIEPVEYPVLLWLLSRCHFALTDSGGIQEEAPSLGKPVVVMREVTERQESIEAGVSVLVGTDRTRILAESRALLHDRDRYARMARKLDLYGDGLASERIADLLGLAPRKEVAA
jgi:UDP-N-acetylglucosamine 2-epimerase (non-hydrolysing)